MKIFKTAAFQWFLVLLLVVFVLSWWGNSIDVKKQDAVNAGIITATEQTSTTTIYHQYTKDEYIQFLQARLKEYKALNDEFALKCNYRNEK